SERRGVREGKAVSLNSLSLLTSHHSLLALRRIRLRFRRGPLERLQLVAGAMDARNGRVVVHRQLPAQGVVDLRYQARVGHARRLAMAVTTGGRAVDQHRLDRLEAHADPVPRPRRALFLAGAELGFELLHYAQVAAIASARTCARPRASTGSRAVSSSGCISSRYSMIASDWVIARSPSSRHGTISCGLSRR